jgi:hypothetical protein
MPNLEAFRECRCEPSAASAPSAHPHQTGAATRVIEVAAAEHHYLDRRRAQIGPLKLFAIPSGTLRYRTRLCAKCFRDGWPTTEVRCLRILTEVSVPVDSERVFPAARWSGSSCRQQVSKGIRIGDEPPSLMAMALGHG